MLVAWSRELVTCKIKESFELTSIGSGLLKIKNIKSGFFFGLENQALRPSIIDAYDSTREKTIWIDVFHISYIPP